MNCKAVQRRLDAFADGELSGSEMLGVRTHLNRCANCSQEFQALRLLKSDLARLASPTAPDDLEERLLRVLHAQSAARPKVVRQRMRFAAAFGILAAVTVFATLQAREGFQSRAQVASEQRFELHKDQAYTAGEDPLYGGTFMMPASYGR